MRYLVPWLLAVGCQGFSDADGDGLLTRTEHDLGTNPNDRDTDHDGLGDVAEVNVYGTDPLLRDTDGDGADDGEEVDLCLDPLSSTSHPYTLGWPMVPCREKEGVAPEAPPALIQIGKPLRRDYVYDSVGERFDLYDLYGKPTIVSAYSKFRVSDTILYSVWSDPNDHRNAEYFPEKWVLQLALDGDINIAFILASARDEFGALRPVNQEDIQEFCDFETLGCFGDLSMDLFYQVGQPDQGDAVWILLDENMVVRDFIPKLPLPDIDPFRVFDDFQQKLSIMLDIVPP